MYDYILWYMSARQLKYKLLKCPLVLLCTYIYTITPLYLSMLYHINKEWFIYGLAKDPGNLDPGNHRSLCTNQLSPPLCFVSISLWLSVSQKTWHACMHFSVLNAILSIFKCPWPHKTCYIPPPSTIAL